MDIIGFKISYADGSVESAVVTDWDSLTSTDVVGVMAYFDEFFDAEKTKRYRKALDGCDWYWFDVLAEGGNGDILGVRATAVKGEWKPPPEGMAAPQLKKSADTLPDAEFEAIIAASMADFAFDVATIEKRR